MEDSVADYPPWFEDELRSLMDSVQDCSPWFQQPPSWTTPRKLPDRNSTENHRLLQIHHEILEFHQLVSPTPHEHRLRLAAVQRFSEEARSLWPDCDVHVFGSFATGLYLPSSDIDVVILNSGYGDLQSRLRALGRQLQSSNIARNVDVIGRARVPIVKFDDRVSGVSFDVSFDDESRTALQAVEWVKETLAEWPAMAPLFMVLKMFLRQEQLHEVYTGGIGSYTLFVMLSAHLKMQTASICSVESAAASIGLSPPNLALLLVGFFELYGLSLKVQDYGISCREGGCFFRKRERGWDNPVKPNLLAAEDPLTPANDIGKNSFCFHEVRFSFRQAFDVLTSSSSHEASLLLARILGPGLGLGARILGPSQ